MPSSFPKSVADVDNSSRPKNDNYSNKRTLLYLAAGTNAFAVFAHTYLSVSKIFPKLNQSVAFLGEGFVLANKSCLLLASAYWVGCGELLTFDDAMCAGEVAGGMVYVVSVHHSTIADSHLSTSSNSPDQMGASKHGYDQ